MKIITQEEDFFSPPQRLVGHHGIKIVKQELLKTNEKGKTYIAHVLRQKVLKSLAHGIAFGHDALPAVITCARGVGHKGSTADNALKALLQGGTETLLTERQGVHNDLFL